ncbi:MAG: glycosyltransferase family 4 protein [Anaerolineales bacterium]|nr:glycosyltransferase family 4 protein [Anaerolineales bacterium]
MHSADATLTTQFELPPQPVFEGGYRPGVKFQFYGMFDRCLSIANVCTQLASNLTRTVSGVALHSYFEGPYFDPDLEAFAAMDRDAPIAMFYGLPDHVPDFFFRHQFRIGGFVCETDRIHSDWVRVCNRMDLVVVPSTFCRSAFISSGVTTPVLVVPHGLEPGYVPYPGLLKDGPFVFYNTFSADSFLERKSCEELIRCFLRAFDRRPDVILRLRTQDSPKIDAYRRHYDFGAVIHVDPPQAESTTEFAKIYSQVHCVVHPSKGEGFGLIPLQAIACETPVIAAPVTGMADYLSDRNAVLLKTAGRVPGIGIGNQSGTYFRIDEDDLVKKMRYVYENWTNEKRKLRSVAAEFRRVHSWENALSGFMTLARKIIAADDLAQAREIAGDTCRRQQGGHSSLATAI